MSEVREAQAKMAREAGIEGFMYWHYWFGNGRQLLERPFNEVLESGKPDFPFCLAWANHSWENKTWDKDSSKNKMLIEQKYLGENDYKKHFDYVLKAFIDKRYITIDEKPVFFIYDPLNFKDIKNFISIWQELARLNGLKGIFFIGQIFRDNDYDLVNQMGYDAICRSGLRDAMDKMRGKLFYGISGKIRTKIEIAPLNRCKYSKFIKYLPNPILDIKENVFPTLISNYDHSPRSGRKALIIENSTPQIFKEHILQTLNSISQKKEENRVVILRSWNEWAEGNYVEPDLKYGHGYLNVIKDTIFNI